MRFGPVPVPEALGAIVAHTIRLGPGSVIKKGTPLDAAAQRSLAAAGFAEVVAARLDPGDLPEDEAAARVAVAAAGDRVKVADASAGRCNLHAEGPGLLIVQRERVDRLNLVDEAVTLATAAPFTPVREGDLIATVKIIPFAVRREVVDACAAVAGPSAVGGVGGRPAPTITVLPFRGFAAGLVLTRLPGTHEGVLDRAAAAQRVRAERLGGAVSREIRCPHDEVSVAAAIVTLTDAGCSPVLVLGASAIVDRRDVIPAAIERAGGAVLHLGMPVDPGNLLLLGQRGSMPIIGVPGCARSLRRSGFDLVLERIAAGLPVTPADVMMMGIGGLLGDIEARPFPRDRKGAPGPEPTVAAVILAAGSSRRMGEINKLLAPVDGAPMITYVVDAVLATRARPVVVVTGHDADAVRAAVRGESARRERGDELVFVHNPRHAEGMSTSLRAGLEQLGEDVDGALICLADMPRIRPAHVEALLGAFDPEDGRSICVPLWERRRGHPVLFAARHFPEMRALAGDVGARSVVEKHAGAVCLVPMDDPGVTLDVDTPEALAALAGA